MRVLLVGFGPFPGAPFNPSALLVKALARRRRPALAGIQLLPHKLKTAYAAVDAQLPGLFALHPDVILIFGLAGRRRELCIETHARNAISVLFPDVDGYRPARAVISPARPSALRGRAPFCDLLGALHGTSFPARLSRDAGCYLCNYAYWRALERAGDGPPLVQFIHIPPVRFAARKLRRGRPLPSFSRLVTAAEALLIALIAASRR
jgi:pyroglutamyl-peptidase